MNFLPKTILALSLLTSCGCGSDESPSNIPTYQGKPVPPIEFEKLHYAHPVLREKVQRLNSLAGGMHLPHEIDWCRRPPSKLDGRRLHDFLAQWSSHRLGVTGSLQPDHRPGARVLIRLNVDPKDTATVWRYSMSTDWRPKEGGWNASVRLYCSQAYRKESVGRERLAIHLSQTNGEGSLHLPIDSWAATLPPEVSGHEEPDDARIRTSLRLFNEGLTWQQMGNLLASPESFRKEALRELEATEARALADIAASRNVRLAKRVRRKDRDLRDDLLPWDDGAGWVYKEISKPDDFELTNAEKQVFTSKAKTDFEKKRILIEENYLEMYPVINKAFPIRKYFEEKIPAGSQ